MNLTRERKPGDPTIWVSTGPNPDDGYYVEATYVWHFIVDIGFGSIHVLDNGKAADVAYASRKWRAHYTCLGYNSGLFLSDTEQDAFDLARQDLRLRWETLKKVLGT